RTAVSVPRMRCEREGGSIGQVGLSPPVWLSRVFLALHYLPRRTNHMTDGSRSCQRSGVLGVPNWPTAIALTSARANSMPFRCTGIAGRRPQRVRGRKFRLSSSRGLRAAFMVSFPGPVHEANGTMQVIIDERAETPQRDALLKIITGEETDPMAT